MKKENAKPFSGKVGRLRYKVWTNKNDQGLARFNVDIYRSYRVEPEGKNDDGWREARSFSDEDLKLIPVILNDVMAYIAEKRAA